MSDLAEGEFLIRLGWSSRSACYRLMHDYRGLSISSVDDQEGTRNMRVMWKIMKRAEEAWYSWRSRVSHH